MIHLRSYQQQAIEDIRAAFREARRVLLVSPTGSGKTVMFSYMASAVRAKNRKVYVLVHREELLEQVCHTLDAFDVHYGVIAPGRPPRMSLVQVASVRTMLNRIAAYPTPDMVIVDEAHHATKGSTWGRVLQQWPSSYVLGVTATPIRLDGKPLTGHFDRLVLGPTTADLMASGDLSKYIMYAPPVAIGRLKMRMGDYAHGDLNREMDKPELVGNAVEHYKALAAGKRALAFCVSLDHAANVERAFTAAGFRAARIDGGMERGERRALVEKFSRGSVQVLTSCELVSEGFDLPAIEVGILMRPTASLSLYLQQVGRALRKFPGKERALILDHAGNSGIHGLPDDDREWSLEEQDESARKKKAAERVAGLRRCGGCFAYVKGGAMDCQWCGWLFPVESREIKERAGELIAVSEDIKPKRSAESIAKSREVGMAKTHEELLKIAAERGYKPGWAAHILAARRGAR